MSKLKRLAGETALYGLGSIVPRFLNFLLVYLHTDVFQPAAYGIFTKLFAYVAVVNIIFMFGMETAYFRFASQSGADEKKVFRVTQTIVLSISGFLSILFIVLTEPICNALDIPQRTDLIVFIVLIMFIDAVVAIPFARLRLQKKAKQFVSIKVLNVIILVGLNIYFLKFAAVLPDIKFIFIANLIANAFFILFFLQTLLSWRPHYDRDLTPRVFNYAYPVMLTGLAGMTNEMFSRITLDEWLPPDFYSGLTNEEALGIFGASYKFGVLMNLAIQAFRYAAEPFFFSHAAEKNSPQLFATVNHYFVIVCCILLLGVSINLDILKYFLGDPEYWSGMRIVPILLLAYLFLGVYYNFSIWFKLTDKTYYGTLISIGGVFVTIAVNYFLIPVYGYMGSTWAAMACYLTMAGACYILGQKYYPIPYAIGKSVAYILCTMALIYGVDAVIVTNPLLSIAFHTVIIIAYVAVIYLLERKGLTKTQA